MNVSTKLMKLFFGVFYNSRIQGQRELARTMIEYAVDSYGERVKMTMPRANRLVVVKQSPIERELNGSRMSFHDL